MVKTLPSTLLQCISLEETILQGWAEKVQCIENDDFGGKHLTATQCKNRHIMNIIISTNWYKYIKQEKQIFDLFCSCVDDMNIWWQLFNFVFLCPKRWFQFNSGIARTHFSSIMTFNNWKMISETRSYIFRWRSRIRRRRVCLSSLLLSLTFPTFNYYIMEQWMCTELN